MSAVREVFPITTMGGDKTQHRPQMGGTMNPDGSRAGSVLDDVPEPTAEELAALENAGEEAFMGIPATPVSSGVSLDEGLAGPAASVPADSSGDGLPSAVGNGRGAPSKA